jgi:Fe-S-cluster containining protein
MSKTVLDELAAIYASLPTIKCQRKCGGTCGLIVAYPTEKRRMEAASGRPLTWSLQSVTCGYFDSVNRACLVHSVRPLICRLFGVIRDPKMTCPWGCQPDRYLTNSEVQKILNRLQALEGDPEPGEGV